jgi:hypothetical protein
MNKSKEYLDRDFDVCMKLLTYLEDEMGYRMCDKVSSHTSNFHKEFPQRGDTTITNFIVSIKRVGLEKMKSDVSQFLRFYQNNLKKQIFNSENVIG